MATVTTAMFDGEDEFKRLFNQMRAITEPCRQMQKQMAAISKAYTSPILEMQKQMQAISNSILEPYRQMQNTIDSIAKSMAPIYDAQRLFQQNIAKQMAATVSQMSKFYNNNFIESVQTLASQLRDYQPDVVNSENGLVIDGETYTQTTIENAITQENILTTPSKWNSLPKPLQWLILLILTTILTWAATYFAYGQIPFAHYRHTQKNEIRQIKHEARLNPSKEILPFISRDNIAVYTASKQHSRIITHLPFKTEITILESRKKKRWLLVEWNIDGKVNCGWIFGRYVFQPSKYRRAK